MLTGFLNWKTQIYWSKSGELYQKETTVLRKGGQTMTHVPQVAHKVVIHGTSKRYDTQMQLYCSESENCIKVLWFWTMCSAQSIQILPQYFGAEQEEAGIGISLRSVCIWNWVLFPVFQWLDIIRYTIPTVRRDTGSIIKWVYLMKLKGSW